MRAKSKGNLIELQFAYEFSHTHISFKMLRPGAFFQTRGRANAMLGRVQEQVPPLLFSHWKHRGLITVVRPSPILSPPGKEYMASVCSDFNSIMVLIWKMPHQPNLRAFTLQVPVLLDAVAPYLLYRHALLYCTSLSVLYR